MRPARGLRLLGETFTQAGWTCLAHPLRSSLGALAVAAAVGTLALVHASLDGLSTYAKRNAARAFGSDTFVLAQVAAPGLVSRRELARMLERNPPLRRLERRLLDQHAGGRVLYAPTVQRGADVSAGPRKLERAYLMGTGAALVAIRDLGLARGRFFSEAEERRAAQVAVIGADVSEALFPGQDPLGRTLRIGGRGFSVIGAQARLGSSGGVSLDRYIYVPLPAYERVYGAPATLSISARAPEGRDVQLAEDRARASLRAERRLAPGEADNFDLLTPEAARGFVLKLAGRVGAAATPISAMALLAAIIVVTNTTLVSVSQRTREIGVRRALGATRFHVVHEVLAESALVSMAGGAGGVLAALLAARLASLPLGFELSVSGGTIALALAHAAGAGLLAGYYPARRAARIDVIAALRTE